MEQAEVNRAKVLLESWEFLKDYNSIGLDIDGVLADFTACYLGELNEKWGYEFTKEDVTDWSMVTSLGIPRALDESIWNSHGLLERMAQAPVHESGRELAELLSLTGKRIHYVTARGMSGVDGGARQKLHRLTEEWLALNDFPLGSVSFWENKAEVARHWSIKAFVEDSPRNALQLAGSGVAVLLVDKPYNQGVEHELIHRVEGWI